MYSDVRVVVGERHEERAVFAGQNRGDPGSPVSRLPQPYLTAGTESLYGLTGRRDFGHSHPGHPWIVEAGRSAADQGAIRCERERAREAAFSRRNRLAQLE